MISVLSALNAAAFYDASVESRDRIMDLKTEFRSDGSDSETLQKAIDDVSNKGGGVVQIPAGTYSFKNIALKSDVHLEIDKGAVIQPAIDGDTKSFSIFNLGVDGDPVENISIRGTGGRYTVELPAYEPGIRVFSFKQVRNFHVSNVNIIDHLTKFSCFQFGTSATSKDGIWRPTQGTIAHANVTGAAYGYGLVQLQSAESVLFEDLSGTGGVTLRLETGEKKMNNSQIGGMDHIIGKNIACTDGNAAAMISPHSMENGVVQLDGIKSIGCGFGVRIESGFIAKKYSTPGLERGTFAKGSYVKNVDATFGTNAQLKSKHFKYMPAQLKNQIQDASESEDGESVRGPSIAGVVNDANYTVIVENVTTHGFEFAKPIVTETDAK
jgi:hypothetical protein